MSVFIYVVRDTLAVFDKFLAGFYGSHKVNLQKTFTSMNLRNGSFLKPFKNLYSSCFIRYFIRYFGPILWALPFQRVSGPSLHVNI